MVLAEGGGSRTSYGQLMREEVFLLIFTFYKVTSFLIVTSIRGHHFELGTRLHDP